MTHPEGNGILTWESQRRLRTQGHRLRLDSFAAGTVLLTWRRGEGRIRIAISHAPVSSLDAVSATPSRTPATIKDVAAAANVSWKTVTNVVHNRPNVRPDTRQRVLDAIEQLDYRPSLAGRQLRQGRTLTLALLVPNVVNLYFAQLNMAIYAAAERRGYAVFVEQIGGSQAVGAEPMVATSAIHFAFDGMILTSNDTSRRELIEIATRHPLVLLSELGGRGLPIDRVEIDNTAAAQEIVAHLTASGRTRIAFLGHKPHRTTPNFRRTGYERGMKAAGLSIPHGGVVPVPEFGAADGEQAVAVMLDAGIEVDAIMCYNDMLAIGAIRALTNAGRRIPDDVAVTGWDDTPIARFLTPSLTTINPHIEQIAEEAVRLMIDRIDGTNRAPRVHRVPHDLVVRESTAGR